MRKNPCWYYQLSQLTKEGEKLNLFEKHGFNSREDAEKALNKFRYSLLEDPYYSNKDLLFTVTLDSKKPKAKTHLSNHPFQKYGLQKVEALLLLFNLS